MASTFQWYEKFDEETLEQGDILFDFPIVEVPVGDYLELIKTSDTTSENLNPEFADDNEIESSEASSVLYQNVILLTQSCDLPKLHSDDYVILCPILDIHIATTRSGDKLGSKRTWKELVAGRRVGHRLINKCEIEGFRFDYQVVDLRRIYTVPLQIVHAFVSLKPMRVRLLPPYREHLAQAFANQFMRIGLPIDLPNDYPYANT